MSASEESISLPCESQIVRYRPSLREVSIDHTAGRRIGEVVVRIPVNVALSRSQIRRETGRGRDAVGQRKTLVPITNSGGGKQLWGTTKSGFADDGDAGSISSGHGLATRDLVLIDTACSCRGGCGGLYSCGGWGCCDGDCGCRGCYGGVAGCDSGTRACTTVSRGARASRSIGRYSSRRYGHCTVGASFLIVIIDLDVGGGGGSSESGCGEGCRECSDRRWGDCDGRRDRSRCHSKGEERRTVLQTLLAGGRASEGACNSTCAVVSAADCAAKDIGRGANDVSTRVISSIQRRPYDVAIPGHKHGIAGEGKNGKHKFNLVD